MHLKRDLIHSGGGSVALLVARRSNNRKVVGSRPYEVLVVCITVLTGNTAWGELSAVAGHHSFQAVGSWSLDCQR